LLPLLNKLPASRRWRLTNLIRKAKILANGAELSPLERLMYWSIFIPKDQIKRLLKVKTLEGKDSAGMRFLQGLYPSSSHITLSQKSAATLQSSLPWIEIHKLQALEKLSGLSIGNPFLTPQIIQFGLGLPDEYKVSGKNGKIVLRMLAKDLVPPAILRRKKANFSPPITEWMNAELGEAVRSLLFSPHSLFEAPIVGQMINQNQSGMADWRSEIWALYILQLWWDKTRSDGQELYGNYSV
jgi:asparagine synthetase B (glutamine-hydrolysing)